MRPPSVLQFLLRHNFAVEQMHFAFGVFMKRGSCVTMQWWRPHDEGFGQFHDCFAIPRIQISGRFVGKQNGWLSAKSTRHRHALLLASGKLRRVVPNPVRHTYTLRRHHRFLRSAAGIFCR
jgi:hypothetical protein